MKFVYFLFIFSFFSCCNNENKNSIGKDEYSEQLNGHKRLNISYNQLQDEYSEQLNEYNRLKLSHFELLDNYNKLQNEYNDLLQDYNQRKLIALQIFEEGKDEILLDYHGNGLYIFGITEIEGYYIDVNYTIPLYVNGILVDQETKVEYDGFIITNAPTVYLDSVRNLISRNNRAYEMNSNGDIIADIKITHFNDRYRDLITKSNKNNTIKLRVFIKHPYASSGRVPAFIEILSIVN